MNSTPDQPAPALLELDGYAFPREYAWLRQGGFCSLRPWRCIDDVDEATSLRREFLLEVGRGSISVRDCLPFARIDDGDDFAGFVQSQGRITGEVCIVHLTFRSAAEVSGYPTHEILPTVWAWLIRIIDDAERHCQRDQGAADAATRADDAASRARRGG